MSVNDIVVVWVVASLVVMIGSLFGCENAVTFRS